MPTAPCSRGRNAGCHGHPVSIFLLPGLLRPSGPLSQCSSVCTCADRLKITLATSYLVSHLGWLCTYYEDTLAALPYDGETVLHWCKREVRWGLDYLLRTHRFPGPERPSTWTDATDSLVLMVRPPPAVCVSPGRPEAAWRLHSNWSQPNPRSTASECRTAPVYDSHSGATCQRQVNPKRAKQNHEPPCITAHTRMKTRFQLSVVHSLHSLGCATGACCNQGPAMSFCLHVRHDVGHVLSQIFTHLCFFVHCGIICFPMPLAAVQHVWWWATEEQSLKRCVHAVTMYAQVVLVW